MSVDHQSRFTRPRGWQRPAVLVAAPIVFGAIGASCSTSATPAPTAFTVPRISGDVDVLYAGSLVDVVTYDVAPAFHAATGATLKGFSAGSSGLAAEIKGGVRQGDVFISASPKVNTSLQGGTSGDWVSWYATFATSKLVLAYNPHSRFAPELGTKPWYQVIDQPGFLLGRTDPTADPKGVLAAEALDEAASEYGEPALRALTTSTTEVYPEETLVGRMQAGQIDAGFFYSVEAKAASLPTVPLTGTNLSASYTITVLNRAPHPAGARAFVSFLLGSTGRGVLGRAGLSPIVPPKLAGIRSSVPAALRTVIPSG